MNEQFADHGPLEDDVRKSTVPAFLETEPGSFKPLSECSRDEVESAVLSTMMHADALIKQAQRLDAYLDS